MTRAWIKIASFKLLLALHVCIRQLRLALRRCTCTPFRDNLRGSLRLIHEDSVHQYPSCKWLMMLTAHPSAVVQAVTPFSRFVLEKRQSRCGRYGTLLLRIRGRVPLTNM